jgi:hypothetical protein
MSNVGSSFYHFDRIRIVSQRSVKTLKEKLPIKELEQECRSFKIGKPYTEAGNLGMKVRLEIFVPSRKALELLHKYDSIFFPYAITYLEITKDAFRESEEQAVSEVKGERGRLRKRWSNSYYIYDPNKIHDYVPNDGYYETPTIYLGGKNVQYVLYARPSKLNGKPCTHGEWRLKAPSTIKRVARISTIADLFLFDIRDFIERQNERLLRDDMQIDMIKLGKWLEGCTKQKKLSDKKLSDIKFHATSLLTTFEIYSFAGNIQYLKAQKNEIKKRENKKRHRRRSDYENKVMKVKDYKRQFAKKLVDG